MSRRARRNIARTAALALVAVSLLLTGSATSAAADGPAATLSAKGWWSQLPVAPPNASKGQLVVQGNPADKSGTAYSAVRYTVDASHTVQSLTLKVGTNGDQGGATAVLLACQTGSAWTPADGGPISAAPKVTSKCINGQRATDGNSWTFAIGSLQLDTVVDVAIVPGADATTKTPSTFSLVFDAPSNDSLATISGPPPTVAPAANETPAGSTGAVSSIGTAGAGSSTFRPPSIATATPAIPSGNVGETATSPAKQAASQPSLNAVLNTAAPAKDRNKTVGFIVLAFAALVGLYAFRQDNLIARNGGSLPGASEEVAGLGRFSRPRRGSPPALT